MYRKIAYKEQHLQDCNHAHLIIFPTKYDNCAVGLITLEIDCFAIFFFFIEYSSSSTLTGGLFSLFSLWDEVFNSSLTDGESRSLDSERTVMERVIRREGVRASSIFVSTISTDFEASLALIPSLEANDGFRLVVANLQKSNYGLILV